MKQHSAQKAVAIVAVGAVLPDATDVDTYWANLKAGRYSIGEVPKERWDPALYFDSDPKAPDKAYSKIGGWVREWNWEPLKWRLPIPPKVADGMDRAQKWAISAVHETLQDYGDRPLDKERTAVILGNAMGGDKHYLTSARVMFPEFAEALGESETFAALSPEVRAMVVEQMRASVGARFPVINEDTMPGELANVVAGRVAALFDLHGPNYITDAACASAMAAMNSAIDGLHEYDYDAVLTGGVDANMSPSTFIKFCKIGALSATGSRPFDAGADGFIMGEGAAIFMLKRLEDAERDGDRIYAVIRGLGGSSDGRGKGITAPNPVGQHMAVERAWHNAGLSLATATMFEAHGTSTRVGDRVEVTALQALLEPYQIEARSIALGSVKSNIGHLKGAAGAAGMLKTTLALHHKEIPPSLGFAEPNPNIKWDGHPLWVNSEHRAWENTIDGIRRAGVSAFGFGGTNFHAVLEEYIPGRIASERRTSVAVPEAPFGSRGVTASVTGKRPLQGVVVVGAQSPNGLIKRLEHLAAKVDGGRAPAITPPSEADLSAPERIAIDFADNDELGTRVGRALKAMTTDHEGMWKALAVQGIFRGSGPAPKVAFLFPGQGSQYVNMLGGLVRTEPVVAETFAEADRVMTPLLGKPLTSLLFVDPEDPEAARKAERAIRQTAVTQPAMLTADIALARLLGSYGFSPDMVMGHSLGEYAALVVAGVLDFDHALKAVSSRGTEMTRVSVRDNGAMIAVFGPLEEVRATLREVDGYCVIANVNGPRQAVVGGATEAIAQASELFRANKMRVVRLPVSHAFHTEIVAPASEPLMRVLATLDLQPPTLPVISNVTGDFHPMGPGSVGEIINLLGRQIAAPVQFVQGLESLYASGARVFVEVGPKRVLYGLVDAVLGDRGDVVRLFTNHRKVGDIASVNQALCGMYAAGLGLRDQDEMWRSPPPSRTRRATAPIQVRSPSIPQDYEQLGRVLAEVLDRVGVSATAHAAPERTEVVITGASLGLPGTERVFDDRNLARILDGENLIESVPVKSRRGMLDKRITRLVKSEDGARFETLTHMDEVIKLAGQSGTFEISSEFGVDEGRVEAMNNSTQLALAVGLEALRDAGIPLVMHYKVTSKGTLLPERWMLPEALRDETGVIFGSAWPGLDALAGEMGSYHQDRSRRQRLEELEGLRRWLPAETPPAVRRELDRRIARVNSELERESYAFNRRFLFRILAMGHSQFAEFIGARGPNTQINAACATGTQALTLATDWIRQGRCKRVVVVSADDVTGEELVDWMGAGFLAAGVGAIEGAVEEVALPFDRRRHGLVMGMGAAGLVVEAREAAADRGMRPICEVLGTATANSAYHGSRLEIDHIGEVMERMIGKVEQDYGLDRAAFAAETVFMSHETFTPARGGSAQAEIYTLRRVFGEHADRIVIANTKGFTGHAMGTGLEDVVAAKILETGVVPPVANFREVDPDLGNLNLSTGGTYPVRYALRFAAGFGSQLAMVLTRWSGSPTGKRTDPTALGFQSRLADETRFLRWLARVSGERSPELEVVHRTLRVVDPGHAGEKASKTARAAASKARAPRPAPSTPPTARVAPAPRPAPAPAPAPARAPDPTPAPADAGPDPVVARVLAIVAEQTGYPPDMLELDLDMEADLGIDTVKQAETFAAVREAYGIPQDMDLSLREFPTLEHVVGWVRSKRPELAPAAPAPASPSAATSGQDEVVARVLEIVAEQTGYPTDMLELDLDMEADLGIDTVKQAETFAAVRESFDIPQDADLQLREFPTLEHVVGWVMDRRARSVPAEEPVAVAETPSAAAMSGDSMRRIPVPVVLPALKRCAPTGVELADGSRVLVVLDKGGVGKALVKRLAARGVEVLTLSDAPTAAELTARLDTWQADGPLQGVYWLPALDVASPIAEMSLDDWREALRLRVKLLYATSRALYGALAEPGSFLVAATRNGGWHGYDEAGATAPLGGAVAGFCKALARERSEATVKVVDFLPSRRTAALADVLIAETLGDPGRVEVGQSADGHRTGVGLGTAPLGTGAALPQGGVYAITGAAGSIVSAITAEMARGGGTFWMLDLAPAPDADDADVALFGSDPDGLKRMLAARIKETGERATPAKVQKLLAGVERRAAALEAVQAVRRHGGEVHYRQLDLTDSAAVAAVMGEIREAHGHLDALIHAAGLEISRMLPDKERSEFDLVFDVKSDGWFNLLSGAGDLPIGATVAFSSIAGRFGNAGQTDYAAANDLLCKFATSFRTRRPDCAGVAIDWTAWADIGMASRGSIPTMMARAGIDMLPPAEGVAVVGRELAAGTRGEVVIAGSLGVMVASRAEHGGVLPEAFPRAGAISGGVCELRSDGVLIIESELDPRQEAFLHDHAIDGTPVLPGVMGIEAFVEAAAIAAPGWHVAAVEDVEFQAPFKFYRDEPRTVRVELLLCPDGDELVARCVLLGTRMLHGRNEPVVTRHFTGVVRLTSTAPTVASQSVPEAATGPIAGRDAVYAVYFHGPAYQVLEGVWRGGDQVVGRLQAGLPAATEGATLAAPRLIELVLQTAGASEIGTTGRMGLPRRIERLELAPGVAESEAHALVTPRNGVYDAVVVGRDGAVLARWGGGGRGCAARAGPPSARWTEPSGRRCALRWSDEGAGPHPHRQPR